jgi:Co/Zn/Cd efflux system component
MQMSGADSAINDNDSERDSLRDHLLREHEAKFVPSNQLVLGVTAAGFLIFVIAEIFGAVFSNSLSLLGDAAAMSVDVFTYICNMYAERVKSRGEVISNRSRLIMEVYIPSFSVCALIGVTIYITQQAIALLMDPAAEKSDDVNVLMLWLFSSLNALVDVISLAVFYLGRKTAFHYAPEDVEAGSGNKKMLEATSNGELYNSSFPTSGRATSQAQEGRDGEATTSVCEATSSALKLNLNMTSAFTHVGGDTLRTISVFVAALISTTAGVRGSITDAWASIVVSATILALVIPLMSEIYKAFWLDYTPRALNTN